MSQEVSGPRRAVWDQADMQVRVSAYDGDCNVGDEGKSVTRVSDVWILGSYACWILEHRKHQRPMRGVGRLGVWSDVTSELLLQIDWQEGRGRWRRSEAVRRRRCRRGAASDATGVVTAAAAN